MTLPANIRVNTQAPFPALVKGSGPITIQKSNGIWTLGFSVSGFAVQIPPGVKYPTDYLFVWDSQAQTFFNMPLSGISALLARTQRSIVNAGQAAITAADQILNLNLTASLVITLPSYLTRLGNPLTFKDVSLLNGAAFHAQTFAAAAGEKIDGNASVPLNQPGQAITLVPMNDGVNAGWGQQ
jgi:hypothetical protein